MTDDREIARHSLDLQSRARDYRLLDLPGYLRWSERKLAEGELDATIAHLNCYCVWLLSEEVAQMGDAEYEDLLEDLKVGLEKRSD